MKTLKRRVPIFGYMPEYTWEIAFSDFLAGLTVGLTIIPQAIAYSNVADLPPQIGKLIWEHCIVSVHFYLFRIVLIHIGSVSIRYLWEQQRLPRRTDRYRRVAGEGEQARVGGAWCCSSLFSQWLCRVFHGNFTSRYIKCFLFWLSLLVCKLQNTISSNNIALPAMLTFFYSTFFIRFSNRLHIGTGSGGVHIGGGHHCSHYPSQRSAGVRPPGGQLRLGLEANLRAHQRNERSGLRHGVHFHHLFSGVKSKLVFGGNWGRGLRRTEGFEWNFIGFRNWKS